MIVFGYKEHILYSEYIGWIFSIFLNFTVQEKIIYFICVGVGSVLPDVDRADSMVGHNIKYFSNWLNKTVGHRTLTHSLFFITVLYYSANIAFGMSIVSTGIMIGCVLHILFDLMTPMGVSLAYPISSKFYKICPL